MWPSTPVESLIANITTVKAATHMAIQTGINGIINGTYSLHSVTIDGSGGAVVAGSPGTLRVTGAEGTGGATPTSSVPLGTLYKAGVVYGWASLDWDGAAEVLLRGYNLFSLTRGGTGDYTLVFNSTVADPTKCCVIATPGVPSGGVGLPHCSIGAKSSVGGKLSVQIGVHDEAGNLIDADMNVVVFGY